MPKLSRLTWLLLPVCLVGISACSSTVSHDGVAQTATTSSTSPKQDIATDTAAAQAAALKLSDFPPGWTSSPQTNPTGSGSVGGQLAKCLGVSESQVSKAPAYYDSPDFSDPNNNTVSSNIGYRPTSGEWTAAFDLISSPKTPDCLAKAVTGVVNYALQHPPSGSTVPAGLSIGQATAGEMSFPTYGDKSIAYQVKIPVTLKSFPATVYLDEIIAIKGRSGVDMSFQATVTPFPTDQEQHYTELVVGRLTNT
jgi:hypothetical protein